MPAGDPVELRQKLIEFGQRHPGAPLDLLESARSMVALLDEWGVEIKQPELPLPPPAKVEVREAGPTRVGLRIHDGEPQVIATGENKEAVARTLKAVVDFIAKKPLGSMSQLLLECAVHLELVEAANAELRKRLGDG